MPYMSSGSTQHMKLHRGNYTDDGVTPEKWTTSIKGPFLYQLFLNGFLQPIHILNNYNLTHVHGKNNMLNLFF